MKAAFFSRLNLVLFLSSFFLLVLSIFLNSSTNQNYFSQKIQYSKVNTGLDAGNQQLSENNELENDDDFEVACLTMPFLVSFDRFEILNATTALFNFRNQGPLQDVYLSIRNLRI